MMTLCPFATINLIPEGNPANKEHQPRRDTSARLFILHSQVGDAHLYDYFGKKIVVVESHYESPKVRTLTQLVDTDLTADANYRANPRAISWESADDGVPDTDEWNEKQLRDAARLLVFHDIPLRMAAHPYDNGVGYHSQFDEWTKAEGIGKTCPGKIRIRQIPDIIALAKVYKMEWNERVVDNQNPETRAKNPLVGVPTALENIWRNERDNAEAIEALRSDVKELLRKSAVTVTQEQVNIAVAAAMANLTGTWRASA